jgi:hypothetical protein
MLRVAAGAGVGGGGAGAGGNAGGSPAQPHAIAAMQAEAASTVSALLKENERLFAELRLPLPPA